MNAIFGWASDIELIRRGFEKVGRPRGESDINKCYITYNVKVPCHTDSRHDRRVTIGENQE